MFTFTVRRLLSIPPLLLVISFCTFMLLKAAPGDFFQALEEDPSKTLAYVMRLRADNGLFKRVAPEDRVQLGVIQVRNDLVGADGQVEDFQLRFNEAGRVVDGRTDELLEGKRASALLNRFTVDGRLYRLDEEGVLYVEIGAVEGYLGWLWRSLRLDLGESYSKRQPVGELILERVTNTLILSISSLFFAWIVAIPLGVFSAVKPNSLVDHCCGMIAYFGLSIPSVFFALLMILFASYTGWFPVGNMRDLTQTDVGFWEGIFDVAHHLVLPTIVIGTGALAGYMRQMRGEMVETLSKDYVRTARAKGLAPRRVLFRHALRNAINPLVTLFGFSLAALLSGSFLVEFVMNWPGMARLVVDAIFARDEPLVMAAVLMSAILLVLGNLVADLLLGIIDPRIRLG